jgi:two-component system, NtrC family, response regulator AtoC
VADQTRRLCVVASDWLRSGEFIEALRASLRPQEPLEIVMDRRRGGSLMESSLEDRRRQPLVDLALATNGFAIVPTSVDPKAGRSPREAVGTVSRDLRGTRGCEILFCEEGLVSVVQRADPTRDSPFLDGSSQMRAIGKLIENIADTDATVLIRGESGVGKDLIARAVHAASARSEGPFVKVNCAAIPQELLESELFGHEKGAFTGAHRRKPGQFELANRGTIYLDEIGELPRPLQAKLLHVLQDFRFSRVGGLTPIDVDARVIATTNRRLEEAMAQGEFREDLYYRLNVVEIRVPPLRERREEIPALVAWFLGKFNAQYGRHKQLAPETLTRLMEHPWSGNVRELENIIRRMVVLADGERDFAVQAARVRPPSAVSPQPMPPTPSVRESLREIARRGARDAERHAISEVLERVHWNRAEAARILKVSYKTLLHKIAECGLTPPSR